MSLLLRAWSGLLFELKSVKLITSTELSNDFLLYGTLIAGRN